jgi:tetraacyldisaccharide 4'-kinase
VKKAMSLLPDADSFKRLVDGTARGPAASLARASLSAVAAPYALAVAARNAAYHAGWLAVESASVPVVSVGNLTLGGTGKTPLVAWVARHLAAAGVPPAIVSRGYGAKPGETSDEAAELAILLPDVPHVANRLRAAGARTAASLGARAIVLDDGFQHRRLARDLDIVAIDATDPFGCGHLFPRGLLREPLAGLARAHVAVLTRADSISAPRRREIRDSFARACGGRLPVAWVEASHRPLRLRSATGMTEPLDSLRGARVVAFAGIGNPAAFRGALESLGATLVGFRAFPDHHAYSAADRESLGEWARDLAADRIVTTLKDLVKVRAETLGGIPLAAVEIAIEILSGNAELEAAVAPVIARARSDR